MGSNNRLYLLPPVHLRLHRLSLQLIDRVCVCVQVCVQVGVEFERGQHVCVCVYQTMPTPQPKPKPKPKWRGVRERGAEGKR